jgi:hypothetical protein
LLWCVTYILAMEALFFLHPWTALFYALWDVFSCIVFTVSRNYTLMMMVKLDKHTVKLEATIYIIPLNYVFHTYFNMLLPHMFPCFHINVHTYLASM